MPDGEQNPLWNELASRAGISLSGEQHARLHAYLEILLQANARMNLTRITDPGAAEVLHIGDALTLLSLLPRGALRLIDVGSGGGVPGIPLAIARPDARIWLLEATKKKANFLREAAAELKLANVSVASARAEEAGISDLRETFDVAVCRAVATMDWLVEWMLPLVKKGGVMLAMKGPKVSQELPMITGILPALGGSNVQIIPANLSNTENHVIVRIDKTDRTSRRYPRSATIAKGSPLR